MAESHRNRQSIKEYRKESRTASLEENRGNRKLPDKLHDEESLSTAGNTANPQYSRTKVRKEEKERRKT